MDRSDPGGPNDGRVVVGMTVTDPEVVRGGFPWSAKGCWVYVSLDFGFSWSAIHRDFIVHGCADALVDDSGSTIYVLTYWGRLFRSTQSGAVGSFSQLSDLQAESYKLAATPDLQRIVATSNEKCAMISTDGGTNWRNYGWTPGDCQFGRRAVALDGRGQRVVLGGGDTRIYFSTDQGESFQYVADSRWGVVRGLTMDDTGTVVFNADFSENQVSHPDLKPNAGNGHVWGLIDNPTYPHGAMNAKCSPLDRCMRIAIATTRGVMLARKQRACLIRDDPDCAVTDESLAQPNEWFSFTRVFADIDAYGAYSSISISASGHRAYTLSAIDHEIYAISEGSTKASTFPAKRTDDRSEWRAIATNAFVSSPGSGLDGLFAAVCTSDGTVYVATTYRMWDDWNQDIQSGSGGAVACTHIQLNADASQVAVLTNRSELWVANTTKDDFSRLKLPAASFRKVLSLTDETAVSLTATPTFDSLVVTTSSSCAMISNDLGATWRQAGTNGQSCITMAASADGQKLVVAHMFRGNDGKSRQLEAPAFSSTDGGTTFSELPKGIYTSAATDALGSVFIVAARDYVDSTWRKGTQMLFGDGRRWAKQGPGFAARSVACSQADKCRTVWVATTDGLFVGKKTREHINPSTL